MLYWINKIADKEEFLMSDQILIPKIAHNISILHVFLTKSG